MPAPPPGHPTSKSKPKPNLPPAISVLPTNPTSGPSQRLQAGTEHGPVLALASKVTSAFSVPTAIPGLSQHSGASSQQPSAGLSTALPAVLPGKVVEARQGAAVTHTEQQHPPQVCHASLPLLCMKHLCVQSVCIVCDLDCGLCRLVTSLYCVQIDKLPAWHLHVDQACHVLSCHTNSHVWQVCFAYRVRS